MTLIFDRYPYEIRLFLKKKNKKLKMKINSIKRKTVLFFFILSFFFFFFLTPFSKSGLRLSYSSLTSPPDSADCQQVPVGHD